MLLPFLLVNLVHVSFCQFFFGGVPFGNSLFPQVNLIAYKPRGLQIIVEKRTDVEQFQFEYSKNNEARHTANMDNYLREWRFFDPELKLKIGDVVNYRITIISSRFDPSKAITTGNTNLFLTFGAQKYTYADSQLWNVTVLNSLCEAKDLQLAKRPNCDEVSPIFEDDFVGRTLNRELWAVEQYIPQYQEENYEFVSYQDDDECIYISDSKLYIKPIVVPDSQLKGTLSFIGRCSRNATQTCSRTQIGSNYLPPVKSGKIVSNFEFKYGKIEIEAKLPIGDWIFPQIELIPSVLTNKYPKILIAYSRGNKKLQTKEAKDIGSNLLFGGYVQSAEEMSHINHLKSIKLPQSLGENVNVFTLTWTPDKIEIAVNDDTYGTINLPVDNGNYRIALGVGVGGNVDFPDDVVAGTYAKPWKNNVAKQVKDFVDAKRFWMNTWVGDNVALQVNYIKVFAV